MKMAELFCSNALYASEVLLETCMTIASGRAMDPVSLEIHPTFRCDLDCRYCYTRAVRHLSAGMSMPQVGQDELMRWIVGQSTIRSIVLSGGGEPLLSPSPLLAQLIIHCARTRILLGILTNALVLPNVLLSHLGEFPLYINVSLKGVDRKSFRAVTGTDLFGRQVQSLGILTRARRRSESLLVSVRLVLDSVLTEYLSVPHVAGFINSLLQDGVDIALLSFSNPDTQLDPERTRQAYRRFYDAFQSDLLVEQMRSEGRLRFSNLHYIRPQSPAPECPGPKGVCFLSGLLAVVAPDGFRACLMHRGECSRTYWRPGEVLSMTENCRNCHFVAFNQSVERRLHNCHFESPQEEINRYLDCVRQSTNEVVRRAPFLLH